MFSVSEGQSTLHRGAPHSASKKTGAGYDPEASCNSNAESNCQEYSLPTFKLLEIHNEENVLVCLRIIIELHKQFKLAHSAEITHFLQFVKNIFNKLPDHLNKIFVPRPEIKVKELSELNIETKLSETFTITTSVTMVDVFVLNFKTVSKLTLRLRLLTSSRPPTLPPTQSTVSTMRPRHRRRPSLDFPSPRLLCRFIGSQHVGISSET